MSECVDLSRFVRMMHSSGQFECHPGEFGLQAESCAAAAVYDKVSAVVPGEGMQVSMAV
jgi:hypothetical protein